MNNLYKLLGITAIIAIVVFNMACGTTAQEYLDNGKRLSDREKYDKAIKELTEALRLDPNLSEAYAYRARSYNAKQDYDRGISDANMAIQLNPKMAMAYFTRGYTYICMNDYDRAIADYTESIRLAPQFKNAYYNRGWIYHNKKNDYDRAMADYTEAAKFDPNDESLKKNLETVRQKAEQENARKAEQAKRDQVEQAEQTRLANLYRQAGNNVGNLRNTTKRYSRISWDNESYISYTYDFGDGNYIAQVTVNLKNILGYGTGTFRVNGDTVIFLSSSGKYSYGTIVGNALTIGNDVYR